MMSRVYVYNELLDDQKIIDIGQMLTKRNIKAIKLKPVENSKDWLAYLNRVKDYLNKLSSYQYDIIPIGNSFVLYRTDVWKDRDSNDYIKNKL